MLSVWRKVEIFQPTFPIALLRYFVEENRPS